MCLNPLAEVRPVVLTQIVGDAFKGGGWPEFAMPDPEGHDSQLSRSERRQGRAKYHGTRQSRVA